MPETESRTVFAAVASTIVGLHMLAVSLAAVPTNPVSDAFESQLDYLSPYFGQSWRLFAPNPVDEDRTLLVQGAYVDDAGKLRVTPWVNWTKVEQDVIEHRLIGGRAGYITSKFYGALDEEYQEMAPEQEVASERTSPVAPPSWAQLEAVLAQVGPDDDDLEDYLDYDRAAARLATNVIDAGAGGKFDITAVRYALREQGVTPYEDRHGSEAERKAARPPAEVRIGGWRRPTYGSAAEARGVEKFFRRHG
jgi:hypothetical protein